MKLNRLPSDKMLLTDKQLLFLLVVYLNQMLHSQCK